VKKYSDLVVDGETEDDKGRKLVAGLRLLRAYGRVADRALRLIAEGKDVDMVVPFVEPFHNSKGHYSISNAAVHADCKVPPLPDYSGLSLRLEKIKPLKQSAFSRATSKQEETASRGYTLHASGPSVGVRGMGKVVPIACDEIVGSVWYTKTRVSWNFRGMSDVKSGKAAVCKALSESVSNALVKLLSEGTREVWHSKAVRVHSVLRNRCRAVLVLDGHMERIRTEVIAALTVNEVHAL
jgi:hypothetical protein